MNKNHRISAGLLMYRTKNKQLEFFLVHPGGPFFQKKDKGWWTIPKGEPAPGESLQQTALREFAEETGIKPQLPLIPLGDVKQKGGKVVHAWAFEGDWQPADGIRCNTFRIAWPPRSGQYREFPEIDQARWMAAAEARTMINAAQVALIDRLIEELEAGKQNRQEQ